MGSMSPPKWFIPPMPFGASQANNVAQQSQIAPAAPAQNFTPIASQVAQANQGLTQGQTQQPPTPYAPLMYGGGGGGNPFFRGMYGL